ncbi:MAG: cytidylate kinase family protein [Candidatus Nanohaloarchaeota archaeon QJJ-9]|nr:cytidylate kinase family protein [Candidatus Nanohaloarchaeota archaeon QJJ-9]
MTVVIVSGPPGAGSSTAAKKVAEEIGLDYWSAGKFFKEESPGEGSVGVEKAWEDEELGSKDFHSDLDRRQALKAKRGDVVLDGKLAIRMAGEYADLAVWLTASLEERARRTAERDDLSLEEARKTVKARERKDLENFQDIYGFDYRNQKEEADLVVDTDYKGPDEIVEVILSRLGED